MNDTEFVIPSRDSALGNDEPADSTENRHSMEATAAEETLSADCGSPPLAALSCHGWLNDSAQHEAALRAAAEQARTAPPDQKHTENLTPAEGLEFTPRSSNPSLNREHWV